MIDRASERDAMVERQLMRRKITDRRVLDAMRAVPREVFVAPGMEEFAYEDGPLPIGHGQTISQPYIVALMIEAAAVRHRDAVLEIGAGSGYAAAVMAQIGATVIAIERHEPLAKEARDKIARAGISNVDIQIGDGTLGWPDAAPFDAIVVAAGGPSVPEALKAQLKVGGRMVIPVGGSGTGQSLLKITRTGDDTWDEQELGAVRFVPLVGAQGWAQDGRQSASNHVPGQSSGKSLPQMVAEVAEPLPDIDDPSFGQFFDRYADKQVVLLGEASHGTSEFYRARAAITRHLVEHHGFNIVAVEADWPDAAAVNRYVTHQPVRDGGDPPFSRFPTWMWRNAVVEGFVEWLRSHNAQVSDPDARAGFYGLDIYNMSGSIAAVLAYLDEVDPEAARIARERYSCLTPWQSDPATYGRAVLSQSYHDCEPQVVEQLRTLLERQLAYEAKDGSRFLDAAQNARLVRSAEQYYRVMYYGGAESWNLRDTHMFETLEHLLEARGPDAKALVWAHNSHIGDARATEMGAVRDQLNIGQLARERFGDAAALIGFGTHSGTVAAATDWNGEMEIKRVRPSREDSYERLCHDAGHPQFLLDLHADPALRKRLEVQRLERFIGVIYRPETELQSHYAEASLPRQFDAFVWFDETQAVTPLGPEHRRASMPETYPFGV
ncbi:protein-L-isoaspartate(D-aspartate) O-methyltransferase [Loktanella sp. SALINAS62]|uniref:protein-L-isoaspartate(D-aspartate) O-methyltransferase n=1 Tax=Loktanella sp. SALINAS62 TaxID=2706124 RepID=UPI002013058F|nr:protein-L-isoaspartate(D-aspartate) O-methyltransferase [Loktanella sp. SALINAS62]MBS1303310.1 protein-L-isoaspartate(D-aspartate) O-methyltransferase [Loktanella sp. SALINAS62]